VSKALIIGASRGIGLEFVRQYRAEGWDVTATARSPAGLRQLAALDARALELDVTDQQAAARLRGPLRGAEWDVAVYVAGVMSHGGAGAAPSRDEFDRTMHANVFGAVQLIPLIAPQVAAVSGKFAFISSGLGSIAGAESSSTWLYRVSKAALNMAVRAAQGDYRDAVFLVLNPGWVRTDMGGQSAPVPVERSIAGMRKVIAAAGPRDAGAYLDYEGRHVPW
jgi:NAD(P)-dependent dehydrogenase (short-subunit alcohol dehydrogenase family)